MSEYIINPMWFYWINVVDAVRLITIIGLCLSAVGTIPLAIGVFVEEDDEYIKPLKIAVTVLAVCLLSVVFIPSKGTLIEMQVAKYATWENAEWTVDAIKDAVDYIVNAIGSIE